MNSLVPSAYKNPAVNPVPPVPPFTTPKIPVKAEAPTSTASSVPSKIIPPFAGAIVRFMIDKGDKHVSVYLDCYDNLGCFGSPYWEIYPYEEDVYRTSMENVDDLMLRIGQILD